jgi:hypothetical protein
MQLRVRWGSCALDHLRTDATTCQVLSANEGNDGFGSETWWVRNRGW